jgi:chemotaxis protein methyltransferase CheR
MVRFEPLNLIGDFSQLGVFDVVFCRNVLLYFDLQTKIQVLQRLAQVIEPDGYLVLGAAETVIGLTKHFKPVAGTRGLYAPASLAEATAAPPSARTRLRVVAAAS